MLCAVMEVIRYDKTSDLHFLQEGFHRPPIVLQKLPFFATVRKGRVGHPTFKKETFLSYSFDTKLPI